ncbi:MAG: helix-turn-helix transcriptional regulator, partial [Solirubrobacterales bacterium]|nr:helix-turn-helix transcriptional regulator [Solirubrobacterales bacterium]
MTGGGPRRFARFDDLERMAALHHTRGGPGAFGGGPIFGHPFGGGRGRARRGEVRTALLLLLAEEPRNGYQLMQEIEQRSGGRWRPSPGSVYPTLAQLEDEGLIHSREADASRLFELTDAGRLHLDGLAGEPSPWQPAEEE